MRFIILCYCVFMQDASSIVSVVCGTNRIAWSHVDRGMMVLDWQQVDCPNFLRGTYMASAYLSDVSIRFFQLSCWIDLVLRMPLSRPPFLHLDLCSRVAPPPNRFLRHREALHLAAEYCALPRHGSHEDSGGHALCLVGTQKHTKWFQYSS